MKNSLHEIKEIQWDWDEDDNGDVVEFVVIDGEKYGDVSYFNQKLKEKEYRFELHKNTDTKTIQDQSDLIEELKAKLAEKEAERHEEWKTGKEWKWEWQRVNQQLEHANQDKISFAVEQLEKVKRTFIDVVWEDVDFAIEIIDQQIKQLKEMK